MRHSCLSFIILNAVLLSAFAQVNKYTDHQQKQFCYGDTLSMKEFSLLYFKNTKQCQTIPTLSKYNAELLTSIITSKCSILHDDYDGTLRLIAIRSDQGQHINYILNATNNHQLKENTPVNQISLNPYVIDFNQACKTAELNHHNITRPEHY